MLAPLVKTEQYGSVCIHKLAKVVVRWSRFRLPEERLVPLEAGRHVINADDRPSAFHLIFTVGRTF